MGKTTEISWAQATWNPWLGCRKVSAGCAHCYAERNMKRYGRDFKQVVRSKTTFNDPVKWKKTRRVFTCSWSDWFIEEADPWRDDAYEVMRQAPHHTYLILTRRPERILDHLPRDWGAGWPNVWLGVSVELQRYAPSRIAELAGVPAQVRFVSAEPLLGPLDLTSPLMIGGVDWVIVGGESGPNRRPMDMAWARSLRDQCKASGVAFYFKQDSDLHPGVRPWIVEEDGSFTTYHEFPEVPDGTQKPTTQPPQSQRQLLGGQLRLSE